MTKAPPAGLGALSRMGVVRVVDPRVAAGHPRLGERGGHRAAPARGALPQAARLTASGTPSSRWPASWSCWSRSPSSR